MINSKKLLIDLKPLLRKLEDDIRQRCEEIKDLNEELLTEYNNAIKNDRTALTFSSWLDDQINQASVAWILSCVFIRFIEDNDLINEVFISGTDNRLSQAIDSSDLYFKDHPIDSYREYLLYVFNNVSKLHVVKDLFDKEHNILWRVGPSSDGADFLHVKLFFQKAAIRQENGKKDWNGILLNY